MSDKKTNYTLKDIIYFIGFFFTMMFAICLVSFSGVSVRTVLEADHVNTMMLISYSALGTILSAAVCLVTKLFDLKGRAAD